MVVYYNFSELSAGTGYISFMQGLSNLTGGLFPLFLLAVTFTVSAMYMMNKARREGTVLDPLEALHVSSLYTSILAILFYVGDMMGSLYVFIPVLIYLITAGIRWYHKD